MRIAWLVWPLLGACGRFGYGSALEITERDASDASSAADARSSDGDVRDAEADGAGSIDSALDVREDAAEDATADTALDGSPDGAAPEDAGTDSSGADAAIDAGADAGTLPSFADPADLGAGVVPAVAWDGARYFVAFYDGFAVYDSVGAVVRPKEPTAFATSTVFTTDTGFGRVWDSNTSGRYEVHYRAHDSAGALVGSEVVLTADSVGSSFGASAWNGASFGMSWQEAPSEIETWFGTFDRDGTRIGAAVRIAAQGGIPRLTWSGSRYGIVWRDYRLTLPEIYFAVLDTNGAIQGSELRVTNDASDSNWPAVAWNGTEYGLAYSDNRSGEERLYFARVSSAGALIAADVPLSTATDSRVPSIAVDDRGGFGVAFIVGDGGSTTTETWFVYVDASGVVDAPVRFASAARQPAIVSTGDGFTVFCVTATNRTLMGHITP